MAKKRSDNDHKGCRLCPPDENLGPVECLDDLDDLRASSDIALKKLAYLDDYSTLDDLLHDPALDDIFAPIDGLLGCKRRVQHRQEGTDQQRLPKPLADQRHRLVVDQIAHLQKQNGVIARAR